MKENILIALAVVLIATMWIQFANQKNNDRYSVVTGSNMLTIMIDKKTGVTWRNCICDAKSGIPGCWEKMNIVNPETYNKTIGEAKLSKKALKAQSQSQPETQAPQGEQK